MINLNNDDNITFFLEEKETDYDKNNEEEIQKMMNELNAEMEMEMEIENNEFNQSCFMDDIYSDEVDLKYFVHKANYGNDEIFYDQEYTVKDLLKICNYYGLDKDIRTSKCKKPDIISTIVYFESLPENYEIVKKRNRMWAYIIELLHDPKMKKFIIF
jgi:hypothetical protein